MEDKEQQGKKYTAVYDRYHSRHEREFDTALDAAQFLLDGENYGQLSYRYVINPAGVVIASNESLGYESLYALGATAESDL